jgi:nitrogenase iron protein NifH
MPIYAANNICRGLKRLKTPLAGVICNSREAAAERKIVERFASEVGSELVAYIPKDPIVQRCERRGVTVIEGAPDSEIADVYRKLADHVKGGSKPKHPEPIDDDRLRELSLI